MIVDISLFPTLKGYKKEYLSKDIFAGIIIAAMSIPISMGYAEVAGMPAVYGLYGSILPILFFALFSTSRQFIFGVDAAPAAIAGSLLVTMNIPYGSEEAVKIIPVVALFTGLWLLLFYILKAGKVLGYISTPVMGGFISGIAVTIIMMQIPKLMGSSAGHGECLELAAKIISACQSANFLSLGLGTGTLVILLIFKKFFPKFPMAIIAMLAGAGAERVFSLGSHGVKLLSAVEPGLPKFFMPDIFFTDITQILGTSLTIAVVVMAETLLAENNFAFKNGYPLKDNREILACAAGNLASAFSGSCPVNGSVSRTAMGEQFEGKTQMMSVVAGLLMILLLLFGTGFIGFLPVPVLTAIVISALMSVVELPLAKRLYKVNRVEFLIFMGAFIGVLLLGTIYGVVIGLILSFVNVVLSAAKPTRSFQGMIPGHENFYDLSRNIYARPVRNTVIYKFNGNLFFANINTFISDLENSITDSVSCIIVDASGINSIDITAADYIKTFDKSLRRRKIKFYLTEHTAEVNDQLRALGLGELIEKGMVRRTVTTALKEIGYEPPFPLEGVDKEMLFGLALTSAEEQNSLQEFIWAFGGDAGKQMEKNVQRILSTIDMESFQKVSEQNLGKLTHLWKKLSTFDEDELLERLEMHLSEISERLGISEAEIVENIEKRRLELKSALRQNPEAYEMLREYEKKVENQLKEQNPEEYQHMKELREKGRLKIKEITK